MHALQHFLPTPADDPCGQTWLRMTVGYRRIHSRWKVVHEHWSLPFNPLNSQTWFIPDPDKLDKPEYGQP